MVYLPPVLILMDPTRQFVVEVGASYTGVGSVLSPLLITTYTSVPFAVVDCLWLRKITTLETESYWQ